MLLPGLAVAQGFSWLVLLTLVASLALSGAVYAVLVHRSTSNRRWIDISEWARGRRMRADSRPTEPADVVLEELAQRGASAVMCLSGNGMSIARLRSPRGAWHVLVRRIGEAANWPATGLRPTAASASLLDLFGLTSFPLLGPTMRFTVYSTDQVAARRLHNSPARALLPADIGLLLSGTHLVLDFSSRPFDPITFGRMTALADQIAEHLPVTG
jgi:hypothetical protein